VSDDFNSYCETQDLIDEAYKDQDAWVSKCIMSVSRMGFFTSGMFDDRCPEIDQC
jgi:glycogen phosphorylase